MERFGQTAKTVLLLGVLSALFLFIGYLLGGRGGVVFALVMSMAMNIGSYWFSDKIVLSLHGAAEAPMDHPVYRIVRDLAEKDSLPPPRVYLVSDGAPNAFATGRDPEHASVCVTRGLLEILDEREVRAVLSHEMSHIKDRDILICTIAATLASAIMYLSHMAQWIGFYGGSRDGDGERRGINPLALLVTVILAPVASMIVQLAISRSREYLADAEGARLSEDPRGREIPGRASRLFGNLCRTADRAL